MKSMNIRFSLFVLALFVFAACQQEVGLQDMLSENALSQKEEINLNPETARCKIYVDEIKAKCGPSCIGEGKKKQCFPFRLPQVCITLEDITASCYGNLTYKFYPLGGSTPAFVFNSTSDTPDFVFPPSAFGNTYYLEVCNNAGGVSPQYYFTMPNRQDCSFDSPL